MKTIGLQILNENESTNRAQMNSQRVEFYLVNMADNDCDSWLDGMLWLFVVLMLLEMEAW